MITIMTTLIVALISPVVFAGERTVTVPTPKSITLVCSDDVAKGTVVLTNPPKFSCEDYETITSVVGLGITVGPDTKVQEISSAINRANRKEKRKSRIQSVSREGNTSTYKMNSGNTVKWTDPVPVVKAPTTPMKVRPEGWKDSPFVEESRPIPQPTFRKYSQKDLATKMNVKPQVINSYEAGKCIPDNSFIAKMETILKCKLPRAIKK